MPDSPSQEQAVNFIVKEHADGFVLVERRTGSVVTAPLSRTEAHYEVWKRNGYHGRPAPSWRRYMTADEELRGF